MNTNWVEKKVTSKVLFKIGDILPMKMFGERECIYEHASPVQMVAAAPKTKLIMINRKDLMKSKYQKRISDRRMFTIFASYCVL